VEACDWLKKTIVPFWKENWSMWRGKQRIEEIKKMKVKDLKKECLRRTKGNKVNRHKIKGNGFKISTDPIPVVPILPRDNLETYVAERIAENDAQFDLHQGKQSMTKTNKRDSP
jgi:hypothetical protein